MIVRLHADKEPYSSYAAETLERIDEKAPEGAFVILRGAIGDPGPPADLYVIRVEEYLLLRREERIAAACFVYGDVASMDAAFAAGCVDYLREPWCIEELRSRALRFAALRFMAGDVTFELRGRNLCRRPGGAPLELDDSEGRILKILVRFKGEPVSRTALAIALWGREREGSRALDVHIARLRKTLVAIDPVFSGALRARRGLGYSFQCRSCG